MSRRHSPRQEQTSPPPPKRDPIPHGSSSFHHQHHRFLGRAVGDLPSLGLRGGEVQVLAVVTNKLAELPGPPYLRQAGPVEQQLRRPRRLPPPLPGGALWIRGGHDRPLSPGRASVAPALDHRGSLAGPGRQQHRNAIQDRVHLLAMEAVQPLLRVFEFPLAHRTDKESTHLVGNTHAATFGRRHRSWSQSQEAGRAAMCAS